METLIVKFRIEQVGTFKARLRLTLAGGVQGLLAQIEAKIVWQVDAPSGHHVDAVALAAAKIEHIFGRSGLNSLCYGVIKPSEA